MRLQTQPRYLSVQSWLQLNGSVQQEARQTFEELEGRFAKDADKDKGDQAAYTELGHALSPAGAAAYCHAVCLHIRCNLNAVW